MVGTEARPAPAAEFPARRELSRQAVLLVLAVLVVQFLAVGLFEAWHDGPTYDESVELAGGVTALTRHQLRFTLEHPPLAKVLAALPVLAGGPVIPSGPAWDRGDALEYQRRFMAAQVGAGKLRDIVFLGRLVPLLEGVLVGLAAYALAERLFGRVAGLTAAGLWLTTPLVVGFAHVDGADLPFALATLAAALALERHLRRPGRGSAVLVGLAGAASLLVRLTGIVLLPLLVLLVVVGGRYVSRVAWRRVLLWGATVLGVAWVALWAVYRAISPFPRFHRVDPAPTVHSTSALVEVLTHLPLPVELRTGFADLAHISSLPGPGYLLGRPFTGGAWWFWPGSLLVKLPTSLLVVLVLGFLGWRGLPRDVQQRGLLVVLVPLVVLAAFTIPQPRAIGVRYLLPVIALAIVAAAPLATRLVAVGAGRIVVVLLAVAQLGALWTAVPHSLAWTAPPFRPGYQVATDSNLDWGQDLYRLERWETDHHAAVAFFGAPGSYEPRPGSTSLPAALASGDPARLRGWVAVSASALTAYLRDELSWLRAYCPVGTIGGTILLYRFDRTPDLTPGPDRPVAPCPGGVSRRD